MRAKSFAMSMAAASSRPPTGGPWYNTNATNGRPFLPPLEELTDSNGSPYGPAQYDEFGDSVPYTVANDRVWTGTTYDGTVWDTHHCTNWSSAAVSDEGNTGFAHGSGTHWTVRGTYGCSGSARLLCLEPGASDPVSLPWLPGALVFLTSAFGTGDLSSWPEAGGASGLAAGDAICRQVATAAHLPAPLLSAAGGGAGAAGGGEGALEDFPSLAAAREDFEKKYILKKYQESGRNMSRTAEALDVERSNLYRKMKGYGLLPARRREAVGPM